MTVIRTYWPDYIQNRCSCVIHSLPDKTPVIYGQWYDGKFDWTTYRYVVVNYRFGMYV